MFNVEHIEYYVKPEKNKVVAIIRGVEWDAAEELARKAKNGTVVAFQSKMVAMPHMLKATAYCHPADTFDEAVGRRIAKKRLMKMYNNTKASTMGRVLAKIKELYDSGCEIQSQISERAQAIDVYSD